MDCLPPGPENEAGRPNSYGQPKVQQRMRIRNDDFGADDYNSHGSDHDNLMLMIVIVMLLIMMILVVVIMMSASGGWGWPFLFLPCLIIGYPL